MIVSGNLVDQEVDAIVNAANSELLLGAGVAGAIRRHGGPSIQAECDANGPIGVGEAAITTAGDLRARYVIHAASMSLGGRTTRASLESAMKHTFTLARERGVETIAIPAVGTGVAGFPIDECARVMAACLRRAQQEGWEPEEVRFVLFGDDAKGAFEGPFWSVYHRDFGPSG